MDIHLQSISGENVTEIAANLINENDGTFDLTTEAGIDEACRRSISYYKSHGFELKYADIECELNRQIKAKN